VQRKQNIALTGFMAVGKSAVGRALARKLKRRFVDLDKVIEKNEGMSVKSIFEQKGEAYFRWLETQSLAKLLEKQGQVIALGGGAIANEDNLKLLRENSWLVSLTASTDALLKRAGNHAKRPLLNGADRRERIEELIKQRERYYALAHATVDTNDLTVDQVADKIVQLVEVRV